MRVLDKKQRAYNTVLRAENGGNDANRSSSIRRGRCASSFRSGRARQPDTIARLIGQSMTERLGQGFVIESRTGAGGNIGTETVVYAASDGYTLLLNGPCAWRPDAGDVRHHRLLATSDQCRQAARACGDDGRSLRGPAGRARHGRIGAKLRGEPVVRYLCAGEHARGHRR